ncbi:transposase, partial [Thiolapillus sp.]
MFSGIANTLALPILWHCQYHIVWVPKYRYRVLTGD